MIYMLKSTTLSFLFIFIFGIMFSSASLGDYPEQNVGEQFTFCQTCADASYINLSSIQTPNETIFVNSAMVSMGSGDFCYNYTPQLAGRYDFRGISDGCLKTFAAYVDVDRPNIVADIILLIFFGSLIYLLYSVSSRINYDSWYNSIMNKFTGKNDVKVIFSGLVYSLVKEAFLLYYLLGWPIIMILQNITTSFGMTDISSIMNVVFGIYSLGLLICVVIFFGKLQEFISNIGKQINDVKWGL